MKKLDGEIKLLLSVALYHNMNFFFIIILKSIKLQSKCILNM